MAVQKACMLQATMRQGTDLKSVPFRAVAYSNLVHGAGIPRPVLCGRPPVAARTEQGQAQGPCPYDLAADLAA